MTKSFRAIATLVGTTIGAGIFGIPFVVSKIGFIPGILYLIILGIFMLLLNLSYGELILRTPGDHQLTGYGNIYLGKFGRSLATLALFISLYGALLAYLIKIGEFLALIFGLDEPILFSVLFFIWAGIAIYLGLRAVSVLEVLIVVFLLGLIFLIGILGLGRIEPANFSGMDLSFLFLPYGVILFALSGSAVIPEMEEILRNEHHNLKKSIIIGSLIPLIVYILFVLVIVGICGNFVSDDTITNLPLFLPKWIVFLGATLAILAMGSSFLSLGYVLREVWFRDFKFSKFSGFILACFPSLVLFLAGAKSFIGILGITGAAAGGLTGILILILSQKVKKTGKQEPAYSLNLSKFFIFILFLMFLVGMISPFI